MSRSGYTDDCDDVLAHGRWRGRVASALRGRRGQALLRDLIAALDAMPEKKLIASKLTGADGCHCALGAVAELRGIDTAPIEFSDDPDEYGYGTDQARPVATALNIPASLACEIMFVNDDEWGWRDNETPEHRWKRMREWAVEQYRGAAAEDGERG